MTSQWEACVVGINYYPSFTDLSSLTAAANDAEAIAAQLEKYGYQSFRVQRLPRQANQKGEWQVNPDEGVKSQELEESLRNLLTPPDNNPPETALFFFSGHGWQRSIDGKDEVFLATSDALPKKGIYGITISSLGQLIQESQAKRIIVWLDCCFSGELTKYLPSNKDYCIFTATRSYEPGIEIKHKEGLFTQTLREGLNPENYADGIVDSHKLAKFVQERMAQTGQAPQCFNSVRSILLTSKAPSKTFVNDCPYRSLSYFSETLNDAQVFYGRTKLTQILVEHIKQQERLIAVFGASGSGKSSLIRAGLLYQLKLGQAIPGSNNWIYLEPFAPTNEPLVRLREVVIQSKELAPIFRRFKKRQSPNQEDQKNKISVQELATFLKENNADQTPIILIVDQFEECFTMGNKETTTEFITFLTELIQTLPNFYLIVGMRSDFRGRLREFPDFSQAIMGKINVAHLNREEIEEAIAKPAEFVGLGIESSLKQQLINDVEDYPGSLPLLQYTLTELWHEARKQEEQFLRLQTYQDLGGIEGTLEKRADAAYASLLPQEQTVAKRIFLELTQVGDRLDTRRRISLGDLVNSHHSLEILDVVTQRLANDKNRLITRTEIDEDISPISDNSLQSKIIIDVVHEALIRHWKLLGDWKQKYQNGMVIERRIEELAQEWEKGGRKNKELYPASKWGIIEGYLKEFGEWGMLDGIAEKFITESLQHNKVVRVYWISGWAAVSLLLLSASVISVWFGLDSQTQKANALKQESIAKEKANLADANAKDAQKQKAIALSEQNNAYKQELIAKEAAKRADDNAKQANSQARQAKINADKAEVQARLAAKNERKANENAQETKEQATIAHQNFIEAKIQAEIAKNRSQEAKIQAEIAQNRSQEAQKQKLRAENAATEVQKQTKIAKETTALVNNKEIGQIEALVSSSNALFKTDETFDSLLAAVQAASKFQRFATLKLNSRENLKTELFNKVYYVLQQAVYGVQERKLAHDNPVFSAVFSPNGEMIATNDAQGTFRLWTKTGKLLKTLQFVADDVSSTAASGMSIAFSSDSQMVAFSGIDKVVRIWNIKDNSLREFKGHTALVFSVSISPNKKILASTSIKLGNSPGEVKLWNIENGQLIKTFPAYDGSAFVVTFSPDGKIIATGGWDNPPWQGKIKLWDIQGNLRQTFPVKTGVLRSLQFSHDGQKIICTGDSNIIFLLNAASGEILTEIENPVTRGLWVMGAKLSPDDQVIASIGSDESVKLWNIDGNLIKELHRHNDMIYGLDFSPDGKTLATSSADKTVKLHKLENDFLKSTEQQQNSFHYGITFSPKGDVFASSSLNPSIQEWVVKLWTKDGKLLKTFPDNSDQNRSHHYGDIIKDIQFSPDGKLIGTASWDGTVKIWTVDGKLLRNFTEHKRPINSLAFSPDSKTLASGGYADENNVNFWMLWDINGKARKILGHSDQIYRIAFSPNGKIVATGSWDRSIKLWNVADGKLIRTLEGKHNSWISGLSFSSDGKMLVSSSQDKTAKIWSVEGNLLHTLIDHKEEVNDVVFSPDSKIIASASSDQTIKLWNTDGMLLRTLRGHNGAISGLSFSPDGKKLVSSSWDGSIKMWNPETFDFDGLLKRGCSWLPDNLKTTLNKQNPTQQICSQEP
jgi:WD40 repeat protein